jgi:hypothetical protein
MAEEDQLPDRFYEEGIATGPSKGEIIETLPSTKDVQTAKGLKQVYPKHILTWTIGLKSGEEEKLSYKYQVYIRG